MNATTTKWRLSNKEMIQESIVKLSVRTLHVKVKHLVNKDFDKRFIIRPIHCVKLYISTGLTL